MTAVTIVAILLPSVPTLIGPYLPDLFEIFNRLAAFSVKKPGNYREIPKYSGHPQNTFVIIKVEQSGSTIE